MSKITISPAQAILLLLDENMERKAKGEPEALALDSRLKELYLSGITSEKMRKEFEELIRAQSLKNYTISFDPEFINQDPTRRYFETHLSYRTLQEGLDSLAYSDLAKHVSSLFSEVGKIDDSTSVNKEFLSSVVETFVGKYNEASENISKEYATYINRVKSRELFPNFTEEQRDKIVMLIQASFLGVVNALIHDLPIDIYGEGVYSDEYRGKKMTPGQQSTRNQHLGLMKGHMMLPRDDIATSHKTFSFLKPSDQTTYQYNALWVKDNFERLVHPFSNSISGTVLCQLRNLAFLRNEVTTTSEKFHHFHRLFISAMLYGSGGHTLHEFSAPFLIPDVQKEFSFPVTLESLFYDNNQAAFNQALAQTLKYNRQILQRKNMLAEMSNNTRFTMRNFMNEAILAIQEATKGYSAYVKRKFFFKNKAYLTKNTIETYLKRASKEITQGDYEAAKKTIKDLKTKIVDTSYALVLVESLEKKIDILYQKIVVETPLSQFASMKKSLLEVSEASPREQESSKPSCK